VGRALFVGEERFVAGEEIRIGQRVPRRAPKVDSLLEMVARAVVMCVSHFSPA